MLESEINKRSNHQLKNFCDWVKCIPKLYKELIVKDLETSSNSVSWLQLDDKNKKFITVSHYKSVYKSHEVLLKTKIDVYKVHLNQDVDLEFSIVMEKFIYSFYCFELIKNSFVNISKLGIHEKEKINNIIFAILCTNEICVLLEVTFENRTRLVIYKYLIIDEIINLTTITVNSICLQFPYVYVGCSNGNICVFDINDFEEIRNDYTIHYTFSNKILPKERIFSSHTQDLKCISIQDKLKELIFSCGNDRIVNM